MNKLFLFAGVSCMAMIVLSGCQTSKELPYFKDLPEGAVNKVATNKYEPLRLQENDELQISISSNSPELSQYFNLSAVTAGQMATSSTPGAGAQARSGAIMNLYRVSSAGIVTMPVLGDVQAAELTTEQLKSVITTQLREYLKDAVVTVTLTNFKVTVIGEVGRPLVVPVNGQTINVLEAIGAAGDMTPWGIRKNVRVLRKMPTGETQVAVLNFNESRTLQSPFFQLRQNDVVYIQPNKSKALSATQATVWIPIATSLASLIAIILTR